MTSGSPYNFYYFNIRGRGEPLRWLLNAVGVEYTEERVLSQDWAAKKQEYAWGKLPVLVVDGVQLHQTTVIARYLGRAHNLLPANDTFANAQLEEVVEAVHDVSAFMGKAFFARLNNNESEMTDSFKTIKNRLNEILEIIEKKVTSEGWIGGNKMSWADVFVAAYLDAYEYYFEGLLDKTSKVKDLVFRVRQIPSIKSYLETRPPIQPFERKP